MIHGPQTKDQLELFLAGIFCLIETGKPLDQEVPVSDIHRRLGVEIVKALNQVEALRPRFRRDHRVTAWDLMDKKVSQPEARV